ncbi:hypothetical protein DS884_10790 [Tenacibaculum sp. E3R01]|nr:hypothetical protein DS884_10790 [Tenacibaculum sp. E3R01]
MWGQTNPKTYSLSNIKCDSVVVYELDENQKKLSENRTVYIYNKSGQNIIKLDYDDYEINTRTKFTWTNNKITSTKVNSKIYGYSPESEDLIGEIRENSFEKIDYIFENKLLKKTEYYDSTEGNLKLNNTTLLEYDSLSRLIKETFIDDYKGYLFHSNINSSQIDSITLKEKVNYSYKKYEYKKEHTLVNYIKDGKLISYEKIFGTIENPTKITQFDNKGQIQRNVVYSRNLHGKITDIKVMKDNFISTWGIERFRFKVDNIKIEYNQKGNPIKKIYITNEKIESIEKIEYYTHVP